MEYKGEIFEPGKLYKFKNLESTEWVIGKLRGVNPDGRFLCGQGRVYQLDTIAELSANELGNIVQKPVELIHGKIYSFDCHGQRYTGLYCQTQRKMVLIACTYGVDDCSNFVELVEKNHE